MIFRISESVFGVHPGYPSECSTLPPPFSKHRLEAHFDCPQDTEWAIDEDLLFPDNVILLQTRPEIIAKQKGPVDQVIDLMIDRFKF